jgi:hypothetical protein
MTHNPSWFKKGHIGYGKGKPRTNDVKNKVSKSLMGHSVSEETRRKIKEARKKQVIKHSKQTKEKIKQSHLGKPIYKTRGANSPLWKGGITPINQAIRTSLEYKIWRRAVFERDNYTCRFCKARSKKKKKVILNADHIKPFAYFPELRFAIDNGRTLCVDCHRKTETYAGKGRKHFGWVWNQ